MLLLSLKSMYHNFGHNKIYYFEYYFLFRIFLMYYYKNSHIYNISIYFLHIARNLLYYKYIHNYPIYNLFYIIYILVFLQSLWYIMHKIYHNKDMYHLLKSNYIRILCNFHILLNYIPYMNIQNNYYFMF